MPTYEYECKKCGDRFEAFASMSAKPLKKCKKCRGSLKRLIGSGAGVIFKGSGFYATDYRSADYNAKANANKAPCAACENSKLCSTKKKS